MVNGAENLSDTADDSEVRCLDAALTDEMVDEIKKYRKLGSSLGGIYEIIVTVLLAGLGNDVHWDRKLDGQLAQVIMGTQAMKGVEIGYGFEAARHGGHEVHNDDIIRWPMDLQGENWSSAGCISRGWMMIIHVLGDCE